MTAHKQESKRETAHTLYIVKADDRSHAAIKAAGPLTCYSKRMTAHKQESKRGTAHTLRSKRMTAHTPPSKRGIAHTLQSKRKTAHTLLKADDRSYTPVKADDRSHARGKADQFRCPCGLATKIQNHMFYHKFLSSLSSVLPSYLKIS